MRGRRTSWTLASVAAAALALVGFSADADPRRGSQAQRLHAKGVHCMDVIERSPCAITNFEALLEVETNERELVTDALMRLIDLYRADHREDDIAALLRRFWDVGMKRDSHGHVPWSTRFMPTDLNIMMMVDMQQMTESSVVRRLPVDARDTLLSCDEARRDELALKREFRRAQRKAKRDDGQVWEVLEDERGKQAERRKKREAQRAPESEAPVFSEALCPTLRALGLSDLGDIDKFMGALNHHDARKSVAVLQIEDLEPKLAQAQTAGTAIAVGPGQWLLNDLEYAGGAVHLLMLDLDELTIAPAALVKDMLAARSKRKRAMNRELDKLASKVPQDVGFLFVMTQAAMRELGFGSVKRSTRSVLEAILPRPQGLQMAAFFGDHLGLFTRVPTATPVKGRMLVSIANTLVARAAEGEDEETKLFLDGLDIAESSDRQALLASYLISGKKLEELIGL